MSYKAFGEIKKHLEIETLKNMSYENINELLCNYKEEVDIKNKEIENLCIALEKCAIRFEHIALGNKTVACPKVGAKEARQTLEEIRE